MRPQRWTRLPRPLDPIRSIKAKLAVLVGATVSVSAFVVWFGLIDLGWLPRYTLPVAVLLALAVTQVLARGMTSPLRAMTSAARAMSCGDYSRRIRATSRDEVGELANAFNRMAADLEAADRDRRELIANVSHELRTPITALQAILENLVDGVTTPDPQALRTALTQTERLGRLVHELLDLSRIDAGTQPLDRQPVALQSILDTAVAAAAMVGRDVTFTSDVSPPDACAWADPGRLHQILANLLDNAARHSPAGGTVSVTAGADSEGLRLVVADDGPGVPIADRERVFERFHRGSGGAVTGATDGGTGLGLAIVRWAVDLHHGTVGIDPDTAPGCRVVVMLPPRPEQALHTPEARA